MLKNIESYSISTNSSDFVTYGRSSYVSSTCTIQPTGGAFGNPCVWCNGPSQWTGPLLGGSGALGTVITGSRILIPNAGDALSISFMDTINNQQQVSVSYNAAAGAFLVYRGNIGGTLLGTSAVGVFPLGAWFFCEMLVTISATVGSVIIKVNGATVLSLTGVNTLYSTRPYVDNTYFNGSYSSFQDSYWCDNTGSYNNTFLGDCRITARFPNAAGSTTNFASINANSNYQNVALVPPGADTDYNYDGTVGGIDLYSVPAPSLISAVFGVQASVIARKDAAATRSVAVLLKSSTTTTTGATVALSTGYTTYQLVAETDPATGVPWLPAALACQIGAQVAA